jgi:uncharacterized membrane protein
VKTFLRFLVLLSLIVWIGGIIYFSFVVAPNVFSVLTPLPGGRHLAGDIVNRTLGALQWIGIGCGVVFLAASTALRRRLQSAENFLVSLMILITLVLIFFVTPRMGSLRASVPDLDKAPAAQAQFVSLHEEFVAAEIAVLLLGLATTWLVAKERN